MTLEELWRSAAERPRMPSAVWRNTLPDAARQYLDHALVSGTPYATAVRLRLRGEIKLQRWRKFTAEEVIHVEHGFFWQARLRMFGLPVRGYDRLIDGAAAMHWRLLRLIPLMDSSGADLVRSAAGRMAAELVWLPSTLARADVAWSSTDGGMAVAKFKLHGEALQLAFELDPNGAVRTLGLLRWGKLDSLGWRYENFGAFVEAERTCGGFTIPTQLRVGWYFGTPRFEHDGEFFRVSVDDARYR